jgi:hypothetical protein
MFLRKWKARLALPFGLSAAIFFTQGLLCHDSVLLKGTFRDDSNICYCPGGDGSCFCAAAAKSDVTGIMLANALEGGIASDEILPPTELSFE